jgi:hypothetical protein
MQTSEPYMNIVACPRSQPGHFTQRRTPIRQNRQNRNTPEPWLINLSELPSLLGTKPVRSELTYLLVSLDKDYTASQSGEPWQTYYARRIFDHFNSSER